MAVLTVAHIADTHLGYKAFNAVATDGRNQRTIDFEQTWLWAVDSIILAKPDIVIHAGDVFHYARPTWQDIRVFAVGLRRLTLAGIRVLVIGGNHDTPRLRTNGSVFTALAAAIPEVRFVCAYEQVEVSIDDLRLMVHAIPYGSIQDNPTIPIPEKAYADGFNIMVAHGSVENDNAPWRFQHSTIWLKYNEMAYDYVALGHHHLHYAVGRRSYYSGSTERCGFSDEKSKPGWLLVELESDKPAKVTHKQLLARPMKTLGAPLDCRGLRAEDIAAKALMLTKKWGEEDGIARIQLEEVDRGETRVAQKLIDRSIENVHCWRVILAPMSETVSADWNKEAEKPNSLSLSSLFQQYVGGRTYKDPTFASRLLERGLEVLSVAEALAKEESE